MKTLLLLLISSTLAFAGPEPIPLKAAPSPAPASYFKAGEFDLSLGGVGSWTKTEHRFDRYFGADHAFGGTLAAKYFFTENIGAALNFSGYDVRANPLSKTDKSRRFVGNLPLEVIFRYPIGSFAPYAFAGAGPIFNGGNSTLIEPSGTIGKKIKFELTEHDVKLLGEGGLGVEYRLTPNWGIFTEGSFGKIDRPHSNFFTTRTGVSFAF
jgi:hypothetical protein